MRYYLIQKLEGIRIPDIKNYNQVIDYQAFERDQPYRIPEKRVCVLHGEADFGGILLQPLPLFSEQAKKSLDLFLWDCRYKELIFMDQKSGKSVLYYLPFFMRIEGRISGLDQQEEGMVDLKSSWREDIPAIYLKTEKGLQIVLRLDLLESLLRRGMLGVQAVPVQIRKGGEAYVGS